MPSVKMPSVKYKFAYLQPPELKQLQPNKVKIKIQ